MLGMSLEELIRLPLWTGHSLVRVSDARSPVEFSPEGFRFRDLVRLAVELTDDQVTRVLLKCPRTLYEHPALGPWVRELAVGLVVEGTRSDPVPAEGLVRRLQEDAGWPDGALGELRSPRYVIALGLHDGQVVVELTRPDAAPPRTKKPLWKFWG